MARDKKRLGNGLGLGVYTMYTVRQVPENPPRRSRFRQKAPRIRGRRPMASSPRKQATPSPASKRAILSGAAAVFTREGIAAARVEDILQESGVSRRTYYKYFSSKEAVVAALHEHWTAEIVRAIESARKDHPEDALAGVRIGVDIFLRLYQSGPRLVRELVEIAMQSESLLAERRRWFIEQIVRQMDASVVALDGRRLDPFVYHALFGAIEGISIQLGNKQATPADFERARAVSNALIDQVLDLPCKAALPRAPC